MDSGGAIREEGAPSWVGHVVVPADSSPASLQGLALAADVARRTGARVTVVHIRHVPAGANLSPGSIGGPVVETLNEMEPRRAVAAEVLDGAGVSWEFVIGLAVPASRSWRP
ncbi:MAG: universal stress protein [Candidatus Dormibacteraeota bacterium]|nr:universal stress protein [Candidatus Dormibacteraeota bacterium]